jgi:hypothetical protein
MILARHPCQTAVDHLPCTRPPDNWGLFRQNPPALASQTDLAGPHAATRGLRYARLYLMGDPSQRAALPPSDSRIRVFGGVNPLEGFLPLPSEGYYISTARTSSMADLTDLPSCVNFLSVFVLFSMFSHTSSFLGAYILCMHHTSMFCVCPPPVEMATPCLTDA